MKTLGILGGMSWESTAVYYRLINQGVARRRGGLHSAPLLLHSCDFAAIAQLQRDGRWRDAAATLGQAAAGLRRAGAGALLLATNTMHKVADDIGRIGGLPLLHIADATGAALQAAGVRHAGLLGTRFTMEDPAIVIERLAARWGVACSVPDAAGRALIHRVIFEELCRGSVTSDSREAVCGVIAGLERAGAEAVILGCTEITLLIDAAASPLPVFDTTALHAAAGVEWILAESTPHLESPPA